MLYCSMSEHLRIRYSITALGGDIIACLGPILGERAGLSMKEYMLSRPTQEYPKNLQIGLRVWIGGLHMSKTIQ